MPTVRQHVCHGLVTVAGAYASCNFPDVQLSLALQAALVELGEQHLARAHNNACEVLWHVAHVGVITTALLDLLTALLAGLEADVERLGARQLQRLHFYQGLLQQGVLVVDSTATPVVEQQAALVELHALGVGGRFPPSAAAMTTVDVTVGAGGGRR